MGTLLIGFAVLAIVVVIVYFAKNEEVVKEYEGGWKGWWVDWLDTEEKSFFIALAVAIVLASWGIATPFVRASVSEKYTTTDESTVYSFKGKGDNLFTIGRHDGCYYILQEVDGNLKELFMYEQTVNLQPESFGGIGSATLVTVTSMKKIRRSAKPFMFFNSKDIVKEVGGCSCGSSKSYTLKVPSNFVFEDRYNHN